jgi:hypothetical protein
MLVAFPLTSNFNTQVKKKTGATLFNGLRLCMKKYIVCKSVLQLGMLQRHFKFSFQ